MTWNNIIIMIMITEGDHSFDGLRTSIFDRQSKNFGEFGCTTKRVESDIH